MFTCRIEFPFLVLLISGGHCLLAVVRNVDDFLLIGKGIDDAPGDAYDKVTSSIFDIFQRRKGKIKCQEMLDDIQYFTDRILA